MQILESTVMQSVVVQNYGVAFRAMGSHIKVWLTAEEYTATILLPQVQAIFEAWETTLSRFRPESELNYLNTHAGSWVTVSPVLFENIVEALIAAEMTDGLVNPLILNALEAAGYTRSFDPDTFKPEGIKTAVAVADWREIAVIPERRAVQLPCHTGIDLGGIAKGWAAQQIAEWLKPYGPCLVNAGGDMVARGTPDDSGGWLVNIPLRDQPVLLNNEAIATSGTDYRRWKHGGKLFHHIIDPRTGRPAVTDFVTATVISPDIVEAEAWAKATLIGGALPALPTCAVRHDGSTYANTQFERRLSHVR